VFISFQDSNAIEGNAHFKVLFRIPGSK